MLCKKLSHLVPFNAAAHPDALVSRHLLAGVRCFSAAANAAQNPPPKTPYIFQYLIDSCGFSPDRASRASKYLAQIKSPSKPDSVIRFLKQSGLDDAHVYAAISKNPLLLLADAETTLKPKLEALRELGFSDSELHQLIQLCPSALTYVDMKAKIAYWRAFYPNNEDLFKAIRRDAYLLTTSIERITSNVSFLRRCSLSDGQIARIILRSPRLITEKLHSTEALVQRAEGLGVPLGSGMFYYALCTVKGIGDVKIKAKIKLLRSLGCSEAAIRAGIQRSPTILMLSEKKIRDSMDFLTKRVGFEPSYTILRPVLLGCSLERRLIPRHCVLQILESKGLMVRGRVYCAMIINEKKFLEKFVLQHKESVPELHEAYVAASADKVAIQSKD